MCIEGLGDASIGGGDERDEVGGRVATVATWQPPKPREQAWAQSVCRVMPRVKRRQTLRLGVALEP